MTSATSSSSSSDTQTQPVEFDHAIIYVNKIKVMATPLVKLTLTDPASRPVEFDHAIIYVNKIKVMATPHVACIVSVLIEDTSKDFTMTFDVDR